MSLHREMVKCPHCQQRAYEVIMDIRENDDNITIKIERKCWNCKAFRSDKFEDHRGDDVYD